MQAITVSKPIRALVASVALCISLQAATAANVFSPIYNFNNGMIDVNKRCQTNEWSRIQLAMESALNATGSSSGRELLRSSSSNHRNLKCSDCGGKPLCLATIGLGCALLKKRRLTEDQVERGLSSGPCASKITAIDSALDTLKPSLLPPCQALLNAPRTIECAEYTKDCDIYSFTVVRAAAQTEVTKILNTTGTGTMSSYCASVGPVTIRAETNFFLGAVTFNFNGKPTGGTPFATPPIVNGYMPYVSFGKVSGFTAIPKPIFTGRTLAPGVYTVSAISQDNPKSKKTATFIVNDC